MTTPTSYICYDYEKLIECLCRLEAMVEKMPEEALQLWKEIEGLIGEIDAAVMELSKALGMRYVPGRGSICERVKILFAQLRILCGRLKELKEEPTGLAPLIEKVEALLQRFFQVFAELKIILRKHDLFPCGDDTGEPPGGDITTRLQPRYFYLQASGSDGSDGSSKGLHTRWTFRGSLAQEHLPKGDLAGSAPYNTNILHNRPDDFVYLHRLDYERKNAPGIDLKNPPQSVTVTFSKREWTYSLGGFSGLVNIFLRFLDASLYDSVGIDPKADPLGFIKGYKGIIEIEFGNSLMFGAEFGFGALADGGHLMLEALSADHADAGAQLSLACRRTLPCKTNMVCTERIVCENIRYFRLKQSDAMLTSIKLEAYLDVYKAPFNKVLVNKFSLTMDDGEAIKRFEDTGSFTIDKQWPQYNDGTTVNRDNYKDKWSRPNDGLKAAVDKYLRLSTTDPVAKELLPSDDPNDNASMPVSYLSILNMVAADYHLARMLGSGHIDVPGSIPADGCIYLATYECKAPLVYPEFGLSSGFFKLVYMSLPTTPADYRLPPQPQMRPITYGLNIEDPGASMLFDDKGYSKFYATRFVNIGREKYDHEIPLEPFFGSKKLFCTCGQSYAIAYGIEYKKQGEPAYRKPEVTSMIDGSSPVQYHAWDKDLGKVEETVPVPDNEDSLFVHSESEEGFHCYAIYGINWFSRASEPSNEMCTDETKFPKKNTLKPPSNLAVQYIQKEETLIFTTADEQAMLAAKEAANPGGDNSFTRVTFEYNHTHNSAYQLGNKINFYFREQLPLEVKGKILSEQDHAGNNLLSELKLTSYTSVETGNLVEPLIPAALHSRFIGGILKTETGQFIVTQIIVAAPYPKIVVQRIVSNEVIKDESVDPETGETITTYHNAGGSPLRPAPDERFSLIENLASEAQWTRLNKQVNIVHFSNYTEQEVQEGGQVITMHIGGITGTANVVASTAIPGFNGLPGVSKVTFTAATLANHADSTVSWYKGTARMATATGSIRAVEVLRIETQNPLVIWVYDSEHDTNPVVTGNNLNVNFHPGYKVYLYPEPAKSFDRPHVEPTSGHSKKTLIGTQSADTTNVPEHRSAVSIPAVLLAQRIIEPVPPGIPMGSTFATRPDFYGKSTYTFDVEANTSGGRTPFGFVFFRADDVSILEAIYKKTTVAQIVQALANLSTNAFAVNRFNDLANVVFDSDPAHQGKFKEYDGYRLPNPDKTGLLTGSETVPEKQQKLKKAINNVFVPLTTTPPLFGFIKLGRTTEGVPPKIKDSNGNLLSQADPAFNPYPMVRKFTDLGKTYIRFTDYTLDGTSVNMFFYYAVEISSQLVMSDRGPINGPVMLVNSFPPEAPAIKALIPQTANPVEDKGAMVFFQVEPYLENERVEKFSIFRTTNAAQAQTVRTMTLAATCEPGQIVDAFDDLNFPPFGEVIYYRLVALRKIINEQSLEEWIPSKASGLLAANVIDVINPEPPLLSYTYSSIDAQNRLLNVQFTWQPTCYNGEYHLYRRTKKGNWEKIHSVKSNAAMNFSLGTLDKKNAEGKAVYHHYKIEVVNASGLTSLSGSEKTI